MDQSTDIATIEQRQPATSNVMVEKAKAHEISEIQTRVLAAVRIPRDLAGVRADILAACESPFLAEVSQYEYAKGGAEITGPSIRLAEALAAAYGNIKFGIEEIERRRGQGNIPGESVMKSYCWDMQKNVMVDRTFTVRHWRDTKQGGYALKDERDIYELTMNMGARRLRACILEIIPNYLVQEAIAKCDATLEKSTGPTSEMAKKILQAFTPFHVTQEMLEKRIQCKLDAISKTQFVSLQKIKQSLSDGMSKPSQWFDGIEETPQNEPVSAPATNSAPVPQSLGKKTAITTQENVNKPATAKVKNSAPASREEALQKKAEPTPPADLDFEKHAAVEPPIEELPPFMDVWNDIGKVAEKLWPDAAASRAAAFCRQISGKGPQELRAVDDVKALIKVYEAILQEVAR
jgi:hypothetical protein